jgi:hypothetical protein
MFQQAALCKAPRSTKGKNYLSAQVDRLERDPLGLWHELKTKQAARPRGKASAVDNSTAARGRRAVDHVREGWASRARAALEG